MVYTVHFKSVWDKFSLSQIQDVLALQPSCSVFAYECVVQQGLSLTRNCPRKVTRWNGAARLWAKRLNEVEPKVTPRCLILGLCVSY